MTAVIQPTISTPFNTTPGPPSCRLDGPFSFAEPAPDLDNISLNTIIQERSRPGSPVSVFSVASAPTRHNDENISPLSQLGKGGSKLRSASPNCPNTSARSSAKRNGKADNFASQPLIACYDAAKDKRPDEAVKSRAGKGITYHSSTHDNIADRHLGRASPQQLLTPAPAPIAKTRPINHSHNAIRTPETGVLTRIRELRLESSSKDQEPERTSPTPAMALLHQQRLSDGSSSFVHSMKTASVTNGSFSIFPTRSSRMGKSTDSYLHYHDSQPRHSMDSDRPLSSCSFDDIALKRGLKRQQIIDELILTEETYVADLKALVYLYSTLLASASSISNRLRFAVEQNVEALLHSHKRMVEKLHSARLGAAARRWADTAVPVKLGYTRRSHLRCSERASQARPITGHRHTRSDETEAYTSVVHQSRSAEPIDVFEITVIFKDAIGGFSAYEEYCANFETIGHELQKHMPQLWPTYESGVESLARAVMALDQRQTNDKRGLTVGDLLIKPVQRLTKYPLLLEQLLHSTPVADAPDTHAELDLVLQAIRDMVQMVNLARDSQYTRMQIQKRWLLQDRLDLTKVNISPEQFRSLGQIELCGVLHITYQTMTSISGGYALCALLDEHFLVAFPVSTSGMFEVIALLQLSDINLGASTDGKGLQCASAFFTWKISFACAGYYHELILSGCSRIEEDHWTAGLRGEFSNPIHHSLDTGISVATCVALDLKSAGVVFSSQKSLSRESSMQRAATVGGRPSISQVIVRNTHNAQDLNEYRDSTLLTSSINRSQSHMNTKRTSVLEPKRSERTRLENSISDIWTKERLPFPGMVGSRGGQIIRASAGTLARKLSLASIHTPFSKGRTSSLSMASRRSYDLFNDAKSTFEIRRKDPICPTPARTKPKDIPEVDDMRSVVGRMIGGGAPLASGVPTSGELVINRSRSRRNRNISRREVGPDDSAAIFYEGSERNNSMVSTATIDGTEKGMSMGLDGPRRRKKRWSNPISKLKEIGSEARSMLYYNSTGA